MKQLSLLTDDRRAWEAMAAPPDIVPYGFYVGTSGYYFEDWLGRFNPPRVSGKRLASLSEAEQADQDRLRFYQRYFPFVEINHTFYREPQAEHFLDMEARSTPRMRYAVKAHRDISHAKVRDADAGKDMMRRHIAAVSPLIETGRFYSFLIQLEDHVRRDRRTLDYLLAVASEAVKMKLDVHVEFRHHSWHAVYPLQMLKDYGIGICNTEIPPVPHAFPLKSYATTDKGYVRYSGRNLETWYPKGQQKTARERVAARNARYDYLYSEEEVEERVQGQLVLSEKVSHVAVAYNNHYRSQAVANAIQNIRKLKEKLEARQKA